MSYSSNPFGSPVGPSSVPGTQRNSIVPGAADSGFAIPTADTPPQGADNADAGAVVPDGQTTGALVPSQTVQGRSPANETLTLAQRFENDFEKLRPRLDNLYNSYFG